VDDRHLPAGTGRASSRPGERRLRRRAAGDSSAAALCYHPKVARRPRVAQEGYDKLLGLTDSRYRLSVIVAKRAAQLKFGVPTVLDPEDVPKNENTVSLAMKELLLSDELRWGDDGSLPSLDDVRRTVEPVKPETPQTFSSPFDDDED